MTARTLPSPRQRLRLPKARQRLRLPKTPAWRSLAAPIDVDGPRIRLGLAWAAASVIAVATGPLLAAVVFAAVALAAAGQATMAWRRSKRRPYRPVAVGGAVLIALGGAAGPVGVAAAAALTAVGSVVAAQARLGGRRWDPVLTAAIALTVGAGAAAVPVVRGELGPAPALVLVLSVLVGDATTFIIGAGAKTPFDAPVASAAAIAALSLAVAAVLVPPFRGASPWVLGTVVVLAAPAGRRVASALLPTARAFAPGLRRLDSFLVAAPVWAAVASAILDVPA